MEPSTPTEETERSREQAPVEGGTIEFPGRSRPPLQETTLSAGPQCAACGATLAPDQRYCVECGQRRGPTLPAVLASAASPQAVAAAPAGPQRRGSRVSPNTALIAGIGTLMLALATGVLIGRTSSPSSPKGVSVQYLAAPASTTAPTSGGGASTSTAGTPSTPTSSAPSSHKTSGSSAAAKVLKGKAPPKAVVKPGTQGKGPGYQKGKFTGNFFGAGNSKKKEEEEELGEEESSGSEKGKK
jgi:hypothetical protein